MKATIIKHKILKALSGPYDLAQKDPNIFPGLYQDELKRETGISDNIIFVICDSLKFDGQVDISEGGQGKNYTLRPWGRQSAYNDYYLYKAREEYWTGVKDVILVVVAVGSFLAGVIFGMIDRSDRKTIQQLQSKVEHLDSVVNHH